MMKDTEGTLRSGFNETHASSTASAGVIVIALAAA